MASAERLTLTSKDKKPVSNTIIDVKKVIKSLRKNHHKEVDEMLEELRMLKIEGGKITQKVIPLTSRVKGNPPNCVIYKFKKLPALVIRAEGENTIQIVGWVS